MRTLTVSVLLVLACSKVLAYEAVTFVEPANLLRMRSENGTVLRVSAVQNQSNNWHFRVTVALGPGEVDPRGILDVLSSTNAISAEQRARARDGWISTDETNLVASTRVEGTSSGKTVVYEFTVSARYVQQSKFTVITFERRREGRSPMATNALNHFWFYLADFVNGKPRT